MIWNRGIFLKNRYRKLSPSGYNRFLVVAEKDEETDVQERLQKARDAIEDNEKILEPSHSKVYGGDMISEHVKTLEDKIDEVTRMVTNEI